ELEKPLKNICMKIMGPRSHIHERSEASFLKQYLMPFIDLFVLEETDNDLIYSLIDGSEKNKSKKPDFMLNIKDKKRDLYFFYVELKRPVCKSIYREENDFVKLLKLMKASVDDQVAVGMANPMSLGLQCEGFKCSLYQMRLNQEGIYLATCARKFLLIENQSMILNTIPEVEVFGYIKI
ncbi:MAG: hypothetical protein EXX96DRAFT_484329, partial [Benjaminiella poitrasii]